MDNTLLFTLALNLMEPWNVNEVKFVETEDKKKELHIYIDFKKGAKFNCSAEGCETQTTAYDTQEKTWRHLNFFQYKTYLHARVPRIKCDNHGIHMVEVPWARNNSGFTLLFEAVVLELAKEEPVSNIAQMFEENDTRLWYFIKQYVEKALKKKDYSNTTKIGIDETSKKGHNYMTIVADLETRKVLYATDGKDSRTITSFVEDFKAHNGNPEKIDIVTCDMSLGFRKGINENFENSKTVIDKFHVIKHINEAVDKVRKEEIKNNPLLNKTKYIWLKNPERLTKNQIVIKEELSKKNLKTSRAYRMKITLQDIYKQCVNKQEAKEMFKKLISWLNRSRLKPMKEFSKLLKMHLIDILNYFENRYTNAILEGINSIIQNIKRRARGFRNVEYFKTMIYLVCSDLKLETLYILVRN